MKIAVVGTRGIPDIQGGVETHCEALYPRLADKGLDITVFGRRPYKSKTHTNFFKNVRLKWLPSFRSKHLEAAIHTPLAIIYSRLKGFRVIHIHACGPGLFVPFAKFFGMKVIFTHHGEDYKRMKWGKIAKKLLKIGERWAIKFSNLVICVSPFLAEQKSTEYKRQCHPIVNGLLIPPRKSDDGHALLDQFELTSNKFIIAIGRLVPEKGFDLLIRAFASSGIDKDFKLVIVGQSDHHSSYADQLKKSAPLHSDKIIFTGILNKSDIFALLTHASLFVLPSYIEGLPISLLEAMSCNVDVIVSDIPTCRLEELHDNDYFKCGDIKELASAITKKITNPVKREYQLYKYDWDVIADTTFDLFQKI